MGFDLGDGSFSPTFTRFCYWTIPSFGDPHTVLDQWETTLGSPSTIRAFRETTASGGQTHIHTESMAIEEAQLCGCYKRPRRHKEDSYPRQFSASPKIFSYWLSRHAGKSSGSWAAVLESSTSCLSPLAMGGQLDSAPWGLVPLWCSACIHSSFVYLAHTLNVQRWELFPGYHSYSLVLPESAHKLCSCQHSGPCLSPSIL